MSAILLPGAAVETWVSLPPMSWAVPVPDVTGGIVPVSGVAGTPEPKT